MGTEINKFIIGALVSAGIHLAICFVPIAATTPTLRVKAIPGSIEVSFGAHQKALKEKILDQSKETRPSQQKIEIKKLEPSLAADIGAQAPGAQEDTSDRGNMDHRGDTALAIPQYSGNPKPPYPEIARRRGYEGTVRLAVEVLASGKVGGVWIKMSSGYEILDQSALKAVKEWRFTPARFAGVAITSTVIVPIMFQLRDELSPGG
jgi:TonB family protein